MIVEFEDSEGNTLGVAHLRENNENGEIEVLRLRNLSFADEDIDNWFGTNESKIRLQVVDNL